MGREGALRRVLDGALDAVVATDRDGAIVGWNRAAEALFGWAKDEVLGRAVQDVIIPARDREEFVVRLRGIAADDVRTHRERTLVDRHGRELVVEAGVAATQDGDCVVVTAFMRDISERKRAERLRETEHGIARLLAGVPDGRELTAACQPIIGAGLGWAAVEGYMLAGEGLRLVARWGSEARPPALDIAEQARLRRAMVELPGLLAAPVVIGGDVRGVTVVRDAPDRLPREDEVAVLANITRTLEQYGERRLAEHRLEQETLALAEVARASRRLSMAAGSAEARQALCDAARQICGASIALLAEPDGDDLVVTAVAGETPEGTGMPPGRLGPETVVHRVHVSGEALFVPDAQTDPRASNETARELGVRSALAQPLRRGDHALGVLAISWGERIESASKGIRLLVGLLADEGAIALSRAEVYTSMASAARTDPLTGLPNLRGWDEALARELARARRTGRPFSVALLDIDGFKQVNDAGGHQAGDRTLRESVSAWLSVVRAGDLIARLGGDEFAVALPDCDGSDARELGERLRVATPQPQTSSVGTAQWRDDETAESLLERADRALYTAKGEGRNRTVAAP